MSTVGTIAPSTIAPGTSAVATSHPRTAAPVRRALTTRFLDFWLLGGASLLVWLVMISVEGFRASWAIDQHFRNLTITTASLSLIVNYPHFLVSYKLAYGRGRGFVARNWWQLLAVPLLLTAGFAAAYLFYEVPAGQVPLLSGLAATLGEWGQNGRVLSGPRFGDVVFTAGFNLMIFTVGWHYTKQVFGCMMVYSAFDGYRISPAQRSLTKWALLSIWGMNFIYANLGASQNTFSQFTYYSFDLPDVVAPLSQIVVGAGFVLVLYKVFWANYTATGQTPSLNLLAPFIALYVWWLPITRQNEFYFLLTPLFHSLQYLAFVYKVEDARLQGAKHPELQGTALIVGLVLAGWLAFEFVPNSLDNGLGTFTAWNMFFFFTAATLFINIHHYFIDNVIWRMRDPVVRERLLA